MPDINADFSAPAVVEVNPHNLTTPVVLESVDSPQRVTTLQRLGPGKQLITKNGGSELFVVAGDCHNKSQSFGAGYYLRLSSSQAIGSRNGCLLFEKSHQHVTGDTGNRIIDTTPAHQWLPGPVEGISICPLHGFESESVMLIRWDTACEFKPGLDPQGEELLVLKGLLQNRDNLYKPLTWLRNPIQDWRRWHGQTGTLVYYKNGHFPQQEV